MAWSKHFSSQLQPNPTILPKHPNKRFYKEIIQAHHIKEQQRNTRFVTPPIIIPLLQIHINKCNPQNDIITTIPTINIDGEQAHIYEDNRRPFFSIPTSRLQWLWNQYYNSLQTPTNIEPSTQSFETEIVWLYQRYKYWIPKNYPLKITQYTLPTPILDHLINTINIQHSYFSSPVTCSTKIN